MHLIISCSCQPHSHSRILANTAFDELSSSNAPVDLIDLRDYALPSGEEFREARAHQSVNELGSSIASAAGILLATPIHKYDVAAYTRLMVELTAKAWRGKVVGLLSVAPSRRAYMSIMGLANTLMLESQCLIVPRFVFATSRSFENHVLVDDHVQNKIREQAANFCRLTSMLAAMR